MDTQKIIDKILGTKEKTKTVRQDKVNQSAIVYDVAQKNSLSTNETNDLISLFRLRFPYNYDKHYITNWAERFKSRHEWAHADLKTRRVLLKVNPEKYKAFKKAEEEGLYPDFPMKVEW